MTVTSRLKQCIVASNPSIKRRYPASRPASLMSNDRPHMSDSVPHLAIVQIDTVPEEFLSHFTTIVRTDGLSLLVQSRPSLPYAGIEWYMPTALFVYIAKPYFESFLKEMGKDHYEVLKNGLRGLHKRVAGPDAPEVTFVSSADKVPREQPYSLFFSVVVEGPEGNRFKLLIPRPITEAEYGAAILAFLEFAEQLHSRKLEQGTATAIMDISKIRGTVLMAFDTSEKRLKLIDPRAARHQ
jgi:hypothetical protein